MICPTCQGKQKLSAILCGSAGCQAGSIPCSTCNGTGQITDEHLKRITKGNFMRLDRINRGLTLREEATRLGVTAIELSHREHPSE